MPCTCTDRRTLYHLLGCEPAPEPRPGPGRGHKGDRGGNAALLSVRVPRALLSAIDGIAAEHGVSRAVAVRALLTVGLK